jgi:hypothetical protein
MAEVALIAVALSALFLVIAVFSGSLAPVASECWRRNGCVLKKNDPNACAACSVFLTAYRYRSHQPIGAASPTTTVDRRQADGLLGVS